MEVVWPRCGVQRYGEGGGGQGGGRVPVVGGAVRALRRAVGLEGGFGAAEGGGEEKLGGAGQGGRGEQRRGRGPIDHGPTGVAPGPQAGAG